RRAEGGTRAEREREYARLAALPQPEAWAVERVQAALELLQRRAAEGRLAEERATWHAEARRRREQHAARLREHAARCADLAGRLGVAPDTDDRQLSWLVERVARWQDAARLVAGARTALERARAQHAAALAPLAGGLATFGYERPARAAAASGALADLERRVGDHRLAGERQAGARRQVDALERTRRELDAACAAILERAGVAADDDAGVQALCARHAAYAAARDECRDRERDRLTACRELEAAPGSDAALLHAPADALEAAREEAAARAAELEPITERLTRLRNEVERAKQACDVEEKLAALRAAEERLLALRQRDLHAMLGDLVLQHVQRHTRDNHRPAVFHRARSLFATITRGRYRLALEDGDAATFRAVDTSSGLAHPLDELSSATRVQLLLAVRVAFVETQERGVRLPLLLDETLGTSDDQRAQAIIDAVIALAGEGRQVFYFTAQRDEVGKWIAACEARGVPHALVDLAAARARRDDADVALPIAALPIAALPREVVPAPDGRTHEEYGAALGVPPVRPGHDDVGATPLWYVVDDVRVLHCLLALGIGSWGALHTLVEHGGVGFLAEASHAYTRAAALARALEAIGEQVGIGRGRPVDRAVLEASGAVSSRHIERVAALAAECRGRAELLMPALEQGRAAGFQRRKAAELREYLEREGYLDPRPVPTPDAMRAGVLAAVADDVHAGTIG
ncbi:MAG TPA: hypothetical protein VFS05_02270, partial [Gemmatimonadaceae bacterium]|nr:hypothetical protein [Gemmatimonadaceae bacterium]